MSSLEALFVNPPNPSRFEYQSTTTQKKPYEAPGLIELGNMSRLTNYSVSVNVSNLKGSGENQGSGNGYEV